MPAMSCVPVENAGGLIERCLEATLVLGNRDDGHVLRQHLFAIQAFGEIRSAVILYDHGQDDHHARRMTQLLAGEERTEHPRFCGEPMCQGRGLETGIDTRVEPVDRGQRRALFVRHRRLQRVPCPSAFVRIRVRVSAPALQKSCD